MTNFLRAESKTMLAPARGLGWLGLAPEGFRLVQMPVAGSHSHKYWDAGRGSVEALSTFHICPPNITNTLRVSSKAAVCI